MKLYSYVVRYDYGFAPNPYHGVCSLATCKADIRGRAEVGDWIMGTGSAESKLAGRLVYAMPVEETLSFDEYWADARFAAKKPSMTSSLKRAFGDNIYRRDSEGTWLQEESRHSSDDGSMNLTHIQADTKSDRVLLSREFVYFGGDGPEVPARLRTGFKQDLVHGGRGYRNRFEDEQIVAAIQWFRSLPQGVPGRPFAWAKLSSTIKARAA